MAKANETTPAPEVDEAALRRKAYTDAERTLRDNHTDEFKSLVLENAAKLGVTYRFRKTKEERAAEQMESLLAEFPELRNKVQQA